MKKLLLLTLMSLCLLASSCSKDDDSTIPATTQRTTEDVTARFKSHFYDESGYVRCVKLSNFSAQEWAIAAQKSSDILEVFNDITGMDAPLTDSYKYRFVSSDGQSTISITGTKNADANAQYATIRVSIPSCSEIQTIHIGTEQYFKGTNDGDVPITFLR